MSKNARSQANPAHLAGDLSRARTRPGSEQPLHEDRTVTTTTLGLFLTSLLSGVQYQGRRIFITRHGAVIAVLIPPADLQRIETARWVEEHRDDG